MGDLVTVETKLQYLVDSCRSRNYPKPCYDNRVFPCYMDGLRDGLKEALQVVKMTIGRYTKGKEV